MTPAYDSSAPVKPVLGFARSGTGDGLETVDARMLVLLRCVLGFSALAVVLIDP